MNETEFLKLAEQTLQDMADAIEQADEDYVLEIDFIGGILNIELPDGGQYVINKHDSSKQIWLSSPKSGAAHFSYNDGKWIDSNGAELYGVVMKEIGEVTGYRF